MKSFVSSSFHFSLFAAALALGPAFLASANTATVGGVTYTYTVSGGVATIGAGGTTAAIATSTAGALAIPATLGGYPVTVIDSYAFENCSRLSSVKIPASVTRLAERAFYLCSGLTNVVIGAGVKSIDGGVFEKCTSLAGITVAPGNTSFQVVDGVLYDKDQTRLLLCPAESGKNSFTMPTTVGQLDVYAFEGCSSLKTVTIDGVLDSISDFAFSSCSALTTVTIGTGVKWIGNYAFDQCSALRTLTIGAGVESIGDAAFFSCSALTAVTIGAGVNAMGNEVFGECASLARIAVAPGNTSFRIVDGVLYDRAQTRLLLCPAKSGKTSFVVPATVSGIDFCAFDRCLALRTLTVGAGVKSIGDYAFGRCPVLREVHYLGNAPTTIGMKIYYGTPNELTSYVMSGSTGWDGTTGSKVLPGTWPVDDASARPIAAVPVKVLFNAAGGVPSTQTVLESANSVYTMPAEPTRSGYRFNGWWTASTGGTKVTDTTTVDAGASTVYAQWLKLYTVTAKGGEITQGGKDLGTTWAGTPGETVTVTAPDIEGKTFGGWSVSPATADIGISFNPRKQARAIVTLPAANVTLTATYLNGPGELKVSVYELNTTANPYGAPVGMQWSVDNGKTWANANNGMAYPVVPGRLTVTFRSRDPRWVAPARQTVTVTKGSVESITAFATRVSVVSYQIVDAELNGATGTIAMSPANGQVLNGRAVTLTARPGKDCLFVNSRNVADGTEDFASTLKAAPSTDATYEFRFRRKADCATPALAADAVSLDSDIRSVGVAFTAHADVNEAARPVKFSATGLPPGLKIDSASGVISGVPSRAGAYRVTVTAQSLADSHNSALITTPPFTISPLPTWAQGSFWGTVQTAGPTASEFYYGAASMTVGANGRITGKLMLSGTNYTFSADSYSIDSGTFDGVTKLIVDTVAKAGRSSIPVMLSVQPDASKVTRLSEGHLAIATVSAGTESLGNLRRNIWKDADTLKVITPVLGGYYTYTFSAPGYAGRGYVTVTLDKAGNARAAGKLPDGTAFSGASSLFLYVDGIDSTILHIVAQFNVLPSAYKGGFISLWVDMASNSSVFDVVGWAYNRDPAATEVYGEGRYDMFIGKGTMYNTLVNLADYYKSLVVVDVSQPELVAPVKTTDVDSLGKKVTTLADGTFETAATNTDLTITLNEQGTAFVVPRSTTPVRDKTTGEYVYQGGNDTGLTFNFTKATGLFKGSFKCWFDYVSAVDNTTGRETDAHVSKTVNYEGVAVQGNPKLDGFYLWPMTGTYLDTNGRQRTYPYNLSFLFSFGIIE